MRAVKRSPERHGETQSSGTALESRKGMVNRCLLEQQDLTAVRKFSQFHSDFSLQAQYYRELIPFERPGAGQQYSFEVDLDRCTGCKACVTACNQLNGLGSDETWRDVGLLHGVGEPAIQHVTTACHHCLDPACAEGCPVQAYEKDPLTGIVKHLDDQCIGCRYCTFTCPYEVPKFSSALGIVRKCDLCKERLEVDEAPACVQSCPSEAIRVKVVERNDVRAANARRALVPGAPPGHLTQPTTRYVTTKSVLNHVVPVDSASRKAEDPHFSLILMLLLTQLSVGAYAVDLLLSNVLVDALSDAARAFHCVVALVVGLLALAGSVLHLGRPLYAFRAVIGIKHSWLSREVVAFGVFTLISAFYTIVRFGDAARFPGVDQFPWTLTPELASATGLLTGLVGAVGIACSVMVYHVTRRAFWDRMRTGPTFFLTATLLGLATLLLTSSTWTSIEPNGHEVIPRAESYQVITKWMMIAAGLKLMVDLSIFRHLFSSEDGPLQMTARLQWGAQRSTVLFRIITGASGGLILPMWLFSADGTTTDGMVPLVALMSLLLTFVGELLERYLFFTSVVRWKMPGALR